MSIIALLPYRPNCDYDDCSQRAVRICAWCRCYLCVWHSHPGVPRIATSWVCDPHCL